MPPPPPKTTMTEEGLAETLLEQLLGNSQRFRLAKTIAAGQGKKLECSGARRASPPIPASVQPAGVNA